MFRRVAIAEGAVEMLQCNVKRMKITSTFSYWTLRVCSSSAIIDLCRSCATSQESQAIISIRGKVIWFAANDYDSVLVLVLVIVQ